MQHVDHQTDFIVLGCGIAGLTAAYYLAEFGSVTILSKSVVSDTTTAWAKGGIATVMDPSDSIAAHRYDTLVAGDGLCDETMVDILVSEGPARVKDLIDLGVEFDHTGGHYQLGREAAHQHRRILHSGDQTGKQIHHTLSTVVRQQSNITIWAHSIAVQIIQENGICLGCVVYKEGKRVRIQANAVIIATGGCGQVYAQTSMPVGCSGDGVVLAKQAGAAIQDMAFVQFHPTLLYGTHFLVSEVVRGEGACLRDETGHRIMEGIHSDRDLAPRDVVARAVALTLEKQTQPYVWLDMTSCLVNTQKRFPVLSQVCQEKGMAITDKLPVIPAAHYMIGGVKVDQYGQTTIDRLYAIGEVASNRVHGANRLASNSLLEGLVFGYRAAHHAAHRHPIRLLSYGAMQAWPDTLAVTIPSHHDDRTKNIQAIMSAHGGIIRSVATLQTAKLQLENAFVCAKALPNNLVTIELMNKIQVSLYIVTDALNQKKNRGCHFCLDAERVVKQ